MEVNGTVPWAWVLDAIKMRKLTERQKSLTENIPGNIKSGTEQAFINSSKLHSGWEGCVAPGRVIEVNFIGDRIEVSLPLAGQALITCRTFSK